VKRTLGHTESLRALAFEQGGKILATGDTLGCLHLWNVETGQELKQFRDDRPPDEERSGITSLAFLPDGKTVASGSDDSFVRLWDTETGQKRRRLEGHTNSVFSIAIAPDGKTLASASEDGTTLVWDSTIVGED
jgi:WD40 repeat protein